MAFNVRTFAAFLLVALTTITAFALDDSQKKEMGEFIRAYILANPEILLEAQQALKKKQQDEQQQMAKSAIGDNQQAIFSSPSDVTLGNPKGDVTFVEFFDYNCGYCKRALSDMETILKTDKNVRFVLKELPILGPDSLAAHKVSSAFRKLALDKYGEFHRGLLGGQDRATEETAIAVATSLGVKEADLRKAMAEDTHDDEVKAVYALANSLGITGTPSYVVGDEPIFGAVGADEIEAKVTNIRSCGKATC